MKTFENPIVEKIEFHYEDQLTASNVTEDNCTDIWVNVGMESCTDGNAHWEHIN